MSIASPGVKNTVEDYPLFRRYPQLENRLPRVRLGKFPTPVQRLVESGQAINLEQLYIKRDDQSGLLYGGNELRKLELLLAQALRGNAREVLTIGFAGSNHALATAIYGRQLGMACTSMLLPQVNAHYVRRNLLAGSHFGARMIPCASIPALSLKIIMRFLKSALRSGRFPAYIPPGGSSPLGIVGFVNAAFELKQQIDDGDLPEPDYIYLPMASMGTSVGLALGLQAAGLRSKIVGVRVIEEQMVDPRKAEVLARGVLSLLRKGDPSFPASGALIGNLIPRSDCLGEGYAQFTREGVRVAGMLKENSGIILNGSYSAKAFSAIVSDARQGILDGKTVLFWNTYNSADLSAMTAGIDYHQLPKPFHHYFENEVQPLDVDGFDR